MTYARRIDGQTQSISNNTLVGEGKTMDAKKLAILGALAVILANANSVMLPSDVDIEDFAHYCYSKNLHINGGAMVWDDNDNFIGQVVYLDI